MDAVGADLVNPPGMRAKLEHVAQPPLIDELLIQLADADLGPGDVGGELAGIGDGAAVDEGKLLAAGERMEPIVDAIPTEPGPQLAECLVGEAAREHLQHALQGLGREIAVRVGLPQDAQKLRHVPALDGDHGHDLLRQHIQAERRHPQLFDPTQPHLAGHHGLFEQVGLGLGDQPALARLTHEMPGPADPLQTAGHLARRFDLADQVDRSHVDPEFQRGGGDDGGQFAHLERLLGGEAGLLRKGTMVRPHRCQRAGVGRRRRLGCQLVQLIGDALHRPPAIGKDQG